MENRKERTQQKWISFCMSVMILCCSFTLGKELAIFTNNRNAEIAKKNMCVVIDAGHGGDDPGKIGVNGILEKDINLKIAMRVASLLELQDVPVVMTRKTKEGLYDDNAFNKKVQDLKRRLSIIEKEKPIIAVSIHQNSYQEEYVHGAQMFYFKGSAKGEKLASLMQESFVQSVDPKNNRKIKENDTYYLLKHTTVPIVIAECGFLSNYEEAELLSTEEYQEKIAWAIHMGILKYLNGLRR